MEQPKLYMLLLGCRVKGRHTEQHDIFFGITDSIRSLIPNINKFWPEAKGRLHIDAWREVTYVDGYKIEIVSKEDMVYNKCGLKLFFLNLGGYKPKEFDEYHYKMLSISADMSTAAKMAKQTTFFKHFGFEGAPSHIDDKYGIDVDDIFEVKEILHKEISGKYKISITASDSETIDEMHLGYFKLDSFK